MALSTSNAKEHELHIQNTPDVLTYFLGFVIAVMPPIAVFAREQTRYLTIYFFTFTLVAVLGALTFGVLKTHCILNRREGKIHLRQTSLYNFLTHKSEQEFDLRDLHSIRMIQYPNRQRSAFTRDKFGIRLSLNGQSVQIASGELSFEECQSYANQIQRFVGLHIPILAVG
jgi:hypothetical protein